ncbi:MAG: fibronectin type III domain-containing protein [Acidobacteria bacterium]|nr:fibronectin type III domain-containing protein [Acidobacteriota bacterium]
MPQYIRFHRSIILGMCFLLCTCLEVFAGDVSLAWNPSVSEGVVGYKVYYGNSSRSYGSSQTVGNQTSYTVAGLSDGTYYFSVTAFDAAGNESGFSNEVSTAVGAITPTDTTPPIISSVASSGITASGATISWTTNEASTSRVEYGTTTGYGSMTNLNTSMQTSHAQALSGLTAGTLYHYRVTSTDEAGNLAVSGDYTFTTSEVFDTTPPVISAVAASGITENGATISWTTNEASTGRVEYGTTAGYGSTTNLNTAMQTSHVQALSGLTGGTLYHFRVLSMDEEGNLAESGDYTFTTSHPVDTTPPEISSVTASGITLNGATISWTTNEASTSQVEYGTTTEYGGTTSLNTSMQTSHAQTLSGLSMDRLYHYRVRSRDAAGNLAVSADFTFRTQPDTTPPTIGSVIVSGITGTEATITWTTNEASDTQVEYGTTTEYGSTTILDAAMQTSHAQVLSGLTMGELYHFRVMSSDEEENLAVSEDYSFTAMPPASTMTAPLFTTGQISGSSELYVGTAITNMDAGAATIIFTAFDREGNRIVGEEITNPVEYQLNPGAQLPLIDVQIFGDNLSQFHSNGWVRMESTSDQVRGFFLTFDGRTRRMDGAGFVAEPLSDFIFTDIEADGANKIVLINNNPENASVTIDLVRANGTTRDSVTETIGSYESMAANIYDDLFDGRTPDATDYVRVSATHGVEPFLMLQQGTGDISFIPAQNTSEGAPIVYSPQYLFNRTYRTSLSVVNLDSSAGSVRFQLFGEDGVQIGETEEMLLEPNGKLYVDDPEFFLTPAVIEEQVASVVREGANRIAGILFGDSEEREYSSETSTSLTDGYVKVTGDGIRIAGNVTFRDRNRETFVSTLPLISELQQSLVFSHVASDDQYFTGIALVNPGSSTATVTLNLYTVEGNPVTGTTLSIPARQRECRPLTEIFPSLQGVDLTNGYIRLSSDVPVAAYSMFGTHDLSMLSAIPGTAE